MHWAQAILFCGGLIYAAVDDLRTRTVSDIVCIVIALAGLITISPASLLGALLCAPPSASRVATSERKPHRKSWND